MSWFQVRDVTTGAVVLDRVRRCSTFLCRLRGLTFKTRLREGEGLLLVGNRPSRSGAAIHMFFVFFPIAVIWLDARGRVVDTRLARPFQPLCAPKAPAKDVLEGPPGVLERVHPGQRLQLIGYGHE